MSGLSFPNFELVAKAFKFNYFKIRNLEDLKLVDNIIKNKNKSICEIFIDKNQLFEPRLVSYKDSEGNLISPPLHDMTPRLSDDEIRTSMYLDENK